MYVVYIVIDRPNIARNIDRVPLLDLVCVYDAGRMRGTKQFAIKFRAPFL